MLDHGIIFIGQEDCSNLSKSAVIRQMESLVQSGYFHFLSGGVGKFDYICSQLAFQLKEKYPRIKVSLIIPYLDYEIPEPSYFDFILFPDKLKPYQNNSELLERNLFLVKQAAAAISFGQPDSKWLTSLFCIASERHLIFFPLAKNT